MAVQLADRGARVAITGRREDKLQETARAIEERGGECLPLLGSVTDPADVRRHYAAIKERWGGLDWAVLNAGISESSNAKDFKAETFRLIFETNIGGVALWLEAVIGDMLAAKSGVIAGIASLAAYRGLPNTGAYSASKAALVTLLESARVDLRGTGVSVVTVCPGFVRSEMTDRNEPKDMMFLLETEDGARRIIAGIEKRRRVVHFPWQLSYAMIYLLHNLPDFFYDWIIAKVAPRRKKPRAPEAKAS